MAVATWNEGVISGIRVLGDHNRHLLDLLGKTHGDFVTRASREAIGPVLDELSDYATYHFALAEYWMRETNYPGYAEHKAEHDRFCGRIGEMQTDFSRGGKILRLELLSLVHTWHAEHILTHDARFWNFVVSSALFGRRAAA